MTVVELLRQLLRTDTVNPPGNEGRAVQILEDFLGSAGLQVRIEKSPEGRPNLVARIEGPRDRPALVLLSHTDVVAVEPEHWSRDPFGGEIHDGHVWGRGALDMKGIGALHAVAAAELARSGKTPQRELILAAVADEEAGGAQGAAWLIEERADLVGMNEKRPPPDVLGEGGFGLTGLLERTLMPIVLGEKIAMKVKLKARGSAGHGSLPPQEQAIETLARVLAKISGHGTPRVHPIMREQFRLMADVASGPRKAVFSALASGAGPVVARALKKPLRSSGAIASLLSDTIATTTISGGYKNNVVPAEASASLDCRLLPDSDEDDFLARLRKSAGDSIEIERLESQAGPVSDRSDLYPTLVRASEALPSNPVVVPSLSPGFTDLRYFRKMGAHGYGWVPIAIPLELLGTIHGHDERVPVDELERGAKAMGEVVARAVT
ncbi:MAG: M20/M25/M40 family metallo-hydrolase [Actinomycetota bacterium]|nr:M20/M25/M40 family metallo-hydrolase [Actinomycetota bacterium]